MVDTKMYKKATVDTKHVGIVIDTKLDTHLVGENMTMRSVNGFRRAWERASCPLNKFTRRDERRP